MQKDVKLENDGELKDFQEYSKDKLAIAKVCVLSTAPNSHELNISEEVLRRDIGSIRGNFLVAHMVNGDARSHDAEEVPVGYFIPDKDIEFEEVEENGQKIVKAWAFAVLSKQYAKEAYNMFIDDNHRATSIEMKVELGDDEHEVLSFDAYGSTILGLSIRPSCKDAEISLVRFAEQAQEFFAQKSDSLSQLKNFVEERKQSMAEKYVNHPINTSKDAVYTGEWDGDEAKKNLVKEKSYKTLAPKVCLRLEEGWEDREVTKLGYPVMGLYDGEWRYSTKALSSALAYAKQNDETEVVNKIEAIYKKLDLDDDSERKEEAKMEEIKELAAIEVEAESTLEEKKEKMTEPEIEVKAEEPNCDECDEHDDEHEEEMSADEMKSKMAELEKDIESRDNIIMEKDAELEELRKFKAEVEEQRKAATVESIMAECKEYMSDEQYKEMREEGMACKMAEIDGWTNKVKAVSFSAVKKNVKKNNDGLFRFAAPIDNNSKNSYNTIWEKLENK